MKPCLVWLVVLPAVFSGTDAENVPTTMIPNVRLTLVNETTVFNCSTSSSNVDWVFIRDQLEPSFIYSYGSVKDDYKDRAWVENYTDTFGKMFNLILHSVTKGDAGRYTCRDAGSGYEKRMEVNLTVLETGPTCAANWNAKGVIGPNSCGTEPETAHLSCSVRYTGNKAPTLNFMKVGENTSLNSSSVECFHSGHTYTCNLAMNSTLQMDGSSYVCQTTESTTNQYNCSSEALRIIYALGEYSEKNATVGDKEKCSVNSSQQCNYIWKLNDSKEFQSEAYAQNIDLTSSGTYICEAICPMMNTTCTIIVKKVVVSPQNPAKQQVALIVGLAVALAIISIAISSFIWKRRRIRRRNQDTRNGMEMRPHSSGTGNFEGGQDAPDETETSPLAPSTENFEDPDDENHAMENESGGPSPENAAPQLFDVTAEVFENSLPGVGATQFSDVPVENPSPEVSDKVDRVNVLGTIIPMVTENHDKRVRGLTILNDELFVACEKSNIIEIFTTHSFRPKPNAKVEGLENPGTIASCTTNKLLYIMDLRSKYAHKKIFIVKPDGTIIKTWKTDDDNRGRISVNKDGVVIVTVYHEDKLKMYSPDGNCVLSIDFSKTPLERVFHAIDLTGEKYLVSYGIHSSNFHRVWKIDVKGNVLESFGEEKGSGNARLNSPAYLAERKKDGSILVADQENHRVIQLNSKLEFLKELFTKEKNGVSYPETMYIYETKESALLFLGCNKERKSGGYILVLPLDQ